MNFKELVTSVAAETNLPASEVKKVSQVVLQKFADLIETQGKFSSSFITFKAGTSSAREASEGKAARPPRKVARMVVRQKKEA